MAATIIVIALIAVGIFLHTKGRKGRKPSIQACASPCEGCDASCPNLRAPK